MAEDLHFFVGITVYAEYWCFMRSCTAYIIIDDCVDIFTVYTGIFWPSRSTLVLASFPCFLDIFSVFLIIVAVFEIIIFLDILLVLARRYPFAEIIIRKIDNIVFDRGLCIGMCGIDVYCREIVFAVRSEFICRRRIKSRFVRVIGRFG
mgnify:CR=1 FL=1